MMGSCTLDSKKRKTLGNNGHKNFGKEKGNIKNVVFK